MSRSKKKTPIFGNCADSEKQCKREYNRRYRRVCKQTLRVNPLTDPLPHLKEHSNPWAMAKDGKRWHGEGGNWGWSKSELTKYLRK